MLDPNTPPPLPPQVKSRPVKRVDGTVTAVVTIRDAARLMGLSVEAIERWIREGKVDICKDGAVTYVLADSLWLCVPEEERRVQ